MKTIGFSILVLAALASAASADSRSGNDLRESPTCFGKYCENATTKAINTDVKAFAVKKLGKGLTAYERMMQNSLENDHGRH